jgi:glutathionylspermidine synthase
LNGSPHKPKCDTFLIYQRGAEIPYGHIAVICEVQDNFIRVAEQNYHFHYWPNNYARQIPLVYRNGLYYIEDKYTIFGWMEIENNSQLQPLNQTDINLILKKYQQSKPIGKLDRCYISNCSSLCLTHSNVIDGLYYKANEDFFVNISNTSNQLYRLYLQATDYVIHNNELLARFGIPKQFWSRIRRSWADKRDFDIIDHLNFKFDGKKLKLCLSKTDNALTILESAVAQEKWAQAMNVGYDFTSSFQLHGLLVRNWKRLNIKTIIHILIDNEQEEMITALYMQKIMTEAGINSKLCIMPNDLSWKNSTIVDKDGVTVKTVWKSWNWEMIFQDYADQYANDEEGNGWKSVNGEHPYLSDILLNEKIRIIEPLWKSITTHAVFLSVLFTMMPNYPNISQDKLILSADSKQISTFNRSLDKQNSRDIVPYTCNTKEHFRIDDGTEEYFNYRPSETIVSWMSNGVFSGFSICNDQNQITDFKNSIIYCCIV